jgi:hypothetical protein
MLKWVWHVQVEHLRAMHADVPQLSVRFSCTCQAC